MVASASADAGVTQQASPGGGGGHLFRGLVAPVIATVTPFDACLNIDYEAMSSYLAYLKSSGAQALLINGSTAENASLTAAERLDLLRFCRQRWQVRI